MKKSKPPISEWRRVIDGCPHRAQHLHDAVVARIAVHGECRLDFDEAGVGLDAVLRCLRHTFEMTSEDWEEFGFVVDFELEDGCWRSSPSSPEQPRYAGGHPKIASGEHEGEFYSVWDMGELVESRGEELADGRTADGGVCVRFEIERPEDYVEVEGLMGKLEFEWSLDLDAVRHGEAGYWTMRYYNGDAEREIDAAIAIWMPFEDAAARRIAFIEAFPRFWGQFEDAGVAAETWRFSIPEPELMVDAIARLCAEPDPGGWFHRTATFACQRAGDRAHLRDALWRARGCEPPSDPWWETPSPDAPTMRRLDAAVVRQLVAFYVMLSLERVLEPDDADA